MVPGLVIYLIARNNVFQLYSGFNLSVEIKVIRVSFGCITTPWLVWKTSGHFNFSADQK